MLHVLAEHCRGAALVPVPIRHFIRGMAIQGILRDFLDVGLLTRCLGFIGFRAYKFAGFRACKGL